MTLALPCPPPLLAWSLRGQKPPSVFCSAQARSSEEPCREPSLVWCSQVPLTADGRPRLLRPCSSLWCWWGWSFSDQAAEKLWVGGGQIRRARHSSLPERKGIRPCSCLRRGRRGSGRGRAGKRAKCAQGGSSLPCLAPLPATSTLWLGPWKGVWAAFEAEQHHQAGSRSGSPQMLGWGPQGSVSEDMSPP